MKPTYLTSGWGIHPFLPFFLPLLSSIPLFPFHSSYSFVWCFFFLPFLFLLFLFILHSLPPSFHLFFIYLSFSFLRFLYFLLSFFSFTFFPPFLTGGCLTASCWMCRSCNQQEINSADSSRMLRVCCSQTVTLKFIRVHLPLPACSRPLSRTRFQSYNRKRPSRYLLTHRPPRTRKQCLQGDLSLAPAVPCNKTSSSHSRYHQQQEVRSELISFSSPHPRHRLSLHHVWKHGYLRQPRYETRHDATTDSSAVDVFCFHFTVWQRFIDFCALGRPLWPLTTVNLLSTNTEARLVTRTKTLVLSLGLNVPVCHCVAQKRRWHCNEAGSLLNRLYTLRQIHLYEHNVKIIRFHQRKFTLLVMFQFISWIFSLMIKYLINVCPQYTKHVPTLRKLHEMSDLLTYMQNTPCTEWWSRADVDGVPTHHSWALKRALVPKKLQSVLTNMDMKAYTPTYTISYYPLITDEWSLSLWQSSGPVARQPGEFLRALVSPLQRGRWWGRRVCEIVVQKHWSGCWMVRLVM